MSDIKPKSKVEEARQRFKAIQEKHGPLIPEEIKKAYCDFLIGKPRKLRNK